MPLHALHLLNHRLAELRSNTSSGHLSRGSKCLRSGLAVRIEIRLLTNANNTVSKALAQSLVVKGSRMKCAAIIPNS